MADTIQAKIAELEAEMLRTRTLECSWLIGAHRPLTTLLLVGRKEQGHQLSRTLYIIVSVPKSVFYSAFAHFFILQLGTLKAKIAKLKSELINGPGGKSAGSKDAGRGFDGT